MMYFFLYFLLINFNQLEETLIKYLPFKREKISVFGKELVSQTYSNAFGVPVICVAQGICAYFLFLICGLEDAALWAFILGIASIIPVVGTAIVWGPAGFYLLSIGHIWQGVTILISGLIILSNVDNVFRFVIQKRMSDVHPVVTVLGIIIGLNFFGLPGLVFGPLLISYLLLMIKLYYIQFGDLDAAPTPETPQQTRQLKITLLNELMRLTKKNH
jgi:predicted PurR-regulated permease PerM